MNAKQFYPNQETSVIPVSEDIPIEESKLVKLWKQLKKAVSVSDETLESWERIESKRYHSRFEQNQWRNF